MKTDNNNMMRHKPMLAYPVSTKPIDALHTHSYGFHTANGRSLIEGMQNAYHTEVQFYVN